MSAASITTDIGDLKTPHQVSVLDAYMETRSYIEGYSPTQQDVSVYLKLKKNIASGAIPCIILPAFVSKLFIHVLRWYRHIDSFTDYQRQNWSEGCTQGKQEKNEEKITEKKNLVAMTEHHHQPPLQKQPNGEQKQGEAVSQEKNKQQDGVAGGDDFDPFAESTPEEVEAANKVASTIKKSNKPKKEMIQKSQIILDVKPASLDIDLDELEKKVKSIEIKGLDWSITCKKLPIAFGLMKLQIGCIIVDDLVDTEDIITKIECLGLTPEQAEKKKREREGGYDDEDEEEEGYDEIPGYVQSVEIVSFNKL